MHGLASWRDVSLVLLALEAFVLCLPLLVIAVLVVRGLRQAHLWLAGHFPIWQSYFVVGRDAVDRYARIAITPLLATAAAFAAIASALRAVSRTAQARGHAHYR
jgi:hypothetical protein